MAVPDGDEHDDGDYADDFPDRVGMVALVVASVHDVLDTEALDKRFQDTRP